MRRLVASGLLPERAGQPVRVWAHVSLAELRDLDDGSVLQGEWIGEMAVRWAARRAAASQTGSDGAAWLDGRAARAVACDAAVIPVVTGQVDPGALDDLVSLCLQFAGHGPHCGASPRGPAARPIRPARRLARPARWGRPQARTRPARWGRPQARTRPASPARPRTLPAVTSLARRARGRPPRGRGDAPPCHHRQGGRPGLRPRRAGLLPAHPAARRPAGRAVPAAGRRPQRRDPGRDPPRGDPAGPALPLGRRLRPARLGV